MLKLLGDIVSLCLPPALMAGVFALWESLSRAYERDTLAAVCAVMRAVCRYLTYAIAVDLALRQNDRHHAVVVWIVVIFLVTHHLDVTTKRTKPGHVSVVARYHKR